MSVTIQTINLTKRYNTGGKVLLALNNLNLSIEEGDCFGFIGPNGAGKSTTIKILATLLQPTWGEARICNYVVGYESRKIRPLIGYVPDSFGAYEDMVVQEYLEFFAAAYDINGAKRKQMVDDVLNLTDLAYKRDAMVDSLSKGMQQRLSLARVLLHDPKVLLLDEPASGLDPRARIEIRELLKELKKMGKTILISSHILPELADLCNKVGIIERGELIFAGTVEAAVRKASMGQVLHVAVADRTADAANVLRATMGIAGVAIDDNVMHVTLNTDVTDYTFIAPKLVESGYRLTRLSEEEVNLETAFMRLTKGVVQQVSASYDILKLAPLNPILLRVVTAGGRRLRHAFTRWGYLGLLIFVLLMALLANFGSGAARSLSDLAKSASQVFSVISYVQLGMICLLAPVFCAAAITQERDSRTYDILLATPLTNAQIVFGSLFSRLYYVVALLLSGAPVFAITLLYGGVTASSIVLSFAIALSTAFFTGSLAIAIAVFRLGSGKTVFWFYVFNAIYLVAVYMIDQSWLSYDALGIGRHTTWLTSIHPFLALEAVVNSTAYPTPELASFADSNIFVRWYRLYPAYTYVALTSFASFAMVVPSAIVLRRIAQRTEVGFWTVIGNILRRGKEARGRRARSVWANPVAWREAATRAGFSGRGVARWVTIVMGLALAVALIYAYHTMYLSIVMMRQALLGIVLVEFSVSLLVATNTSAAAVTKERETQTLDLLLVTPITSRYYIWGKLRGLVSFMLPFAAVPTITVLLVVLYDLGREVTGHANAEWVVWPETVVTLPILLVVVLAWACMLGLQLSLKWSRTLVAVMASIGVLAGISGVLGVCGFTAASQMGAFGLVVAAFSPFTAIAVLINPTDVAASTFSSGASVPEWVGRLILFVSILLAGITYCLIVWAMYRSMVKNFDMIIRRQHQ